MEAVEDKKAVEPLKKGVFLQKKVIIGTLNNGQYTNRRLIMI
jgi:hypothetical protein